MMTGEEGRGAVEGGGTAGEAEGDSGGSCEVSWSTDGRANDLVE